MKPRHHCMRVFGCHTYARIPEDERSKLDAKSRKTILVGFSLNTKAYGLHWPDTSTVQRARAFSENHLGLDLVANDSNKWYVHINPHSTSRYEVDLGVNKLASSVIIPNSNESDSEDGFVETNPSESNHVH